MKKFVLAAVLSMGMASSVYGAEARFTVQQDWGAGYVATVTIDNTQGAAAITSWSVEWTFSGQIQQVWNAEYEISGNRVVARSLEWNGNVPVGSAVEFGLQGTPGNITPPTLELVVQTSGGQGSSFACDVDPSTLNLDNDWLTTDGNAIVDAQGNPVWLTGANWFGFNTSERMLHGLWTASLDRIVRESAQRGINVLRVPISTELLKEWKSGILGTTQGSINYTANPNLEGKNGLEVFDYFLDAAKSCGVKIIVDVHHPDANNSGHHFWGWTKGDITAQDFYDTWEWLALRYRHDDTIIGYDLENEPHGVPRGAAGGDLSKQPGETWEAFCNRKPMTTETNFAKWDNTTDSNNWKHVAETAAARILAANPHALILVEGIEVYPKYGKWVNHHPAPDQPGCFDFVWWGGNLRGVRDYPVQAGALTKQILYSPHDYGPSVYQQPWFEPGFNRDSLRRDVWRPNWLYIHEQGIAPLLIGEWGGFLDGGDNQKWLEALRDEIADVRLHHTFWAINPNSGDTGGLLTNDWTTWDEAKYAVLEPALWQDASGRFVGLDKEVRLGGNQAAAGWSPSEHVGIP